jgi:hypothetical protein
MEKTPATKERRRNARTWLNRPGRIRIDSGRESYMQVVDLSQRGAALYCSTELEPGTDVEVKFHLNMNPETIWLKMRGRVERSYARGDSHLVRILFVEPKLEALETILEYITYKSQRNR